MTPTPHLAQRQRRVAVVFGTRPEAIKLAPVVQSMRASPHFTPLVVTTGQHREMLDQVLRLFNIRSAHDLDLCRPGQTLESVTSMALEQLTPLLSGERPDLIVVQGDTTTTFAAALAGYYSQIPVVHLEAGLRTGDPLQPYPEEMNRRLTSQLSTLHLPPTATSRDNLLREGFPAQDVVVTGNTVIDALRWVLGRSARYADPALARLDTTRRRVLLVTAHRRESWGEPMRAVAEAVRRVAVAEPDLIVALPLHRNPRVRDVVVPLLDDLPNVILTEPASYSDFCRLMQRAHVVLTDSGGVQEEAPSLGKPVLVTRETTERPEAVAAGTVALVGTDTDRIFSAVRELLHDDDRYASMARALNPYGDGRATERTLAALGHHLGLCDRLPEFGVAPGQSAGDVGLAAHTGAARCSQGMSTWAVCQ